jgi:hypothetical protein
LSLCSAPSRGQRYAHFEIYSFNLGTATRSGTGAMADTDFNYGAARDLQLTAMLPAGFNSPAGDPASTA